MDDKFKYYYNKVIEKYLRQYKDQDTLSEMTDLSAQWAEVAIEENTEVVALIAKGKCGLAFLVGWTIKQSKGNVNPTKVMEKLIEMMPLARQ